MHNFSLQACNCRYKFSIISAQVQCTPPKRKKARMHFNQSDIDKVLISDEDIDKFLRGKVSFNPLLVSQKQLRLPAYLYCRFVNKEDLITIKDNGNTFYKQVSEYKSKRRSFPTPPWSVAKIPRKRLGVKDHHYCSKLKSCTPWLSKDFPQSVKRNVRLSQSRDSSEEKIYASIEVDYGDDYVLVQETDDRFGYIPQTFAAGGTVAFPPVDDNEIWTIGFVQAVVYQPGRPHVVQRYRNPHNGKN